MKTDSNQYWYAVQCVSGNEDLARQLLQKVSTEWNTLLPKRVLFIRKEGNTRKEVKPLMPGYFFISSMQKISRQMAREVLGRINIGGSPVVLRILGETDTEHLSSIPESEMDLILTLTKNGEEIGVTKIARENQRFRILSGPLKNRDVLIKKINARKKRIIVEIKILGQTREIQLGLEVAMEEI